MFIHEKKEEARIRKQYRIVKYYVDDEFSIVAVDLY